MMDSRLYFRGESRSPNTGRESCETRVSRANTRVSSWPFSSRGKNTAKNKSRRGCVRRNAFTRDENDIAKIAARVLSNKSVGVGN